MLPSNPMAELDDNVQTTTRRFHRTERLPAGNPHVGTFHYTSLAHMLLPPQQPHTQSNTPLSYFQPFMTTFAQLPVQSTHMPMNMQTYMHYATHSPHLPLIRHSAPTAPTAPIARLLHNMMVAHSQREEEKCGDDWVVVEILPKAQGALGQSRPTLPQNYFPLD